MSKQWNDYALCNGGNFKWFFEQYERDKVIATAVDEMCLSCPVIRQCNARRKSTASVGVWAGIYWNKLGEPDKSFNAHKTEDVWERLKDAGVKD